MKEYEIKVELGSFYYTIEADSEHKAIERAQELICDEAIHNLMEGSKYTIHKEEE
jgi:hypothetical protein